MQSNKSKILTITNIIFMIIAILSLSELIFVRGQFIWIISVFAIAIAGIINSITSIVNKNTKNTIFTILITAGIIIGYVSFIL